MLKILLSFYPRNQREYLVDDQNTINFNKEHLYQKAGYIQQNEYLTDNTIDANVAYVLDEENMDKEEVEMS